MTGNNDQVGCFGFVKVSVSYLEYSIMTGKNDQVEGFSPFQPQPTSASATPCGRNFS